MLPEGAGGVLRIDLASPYEAACHLSELLTLADEHFYSMFGADIIVTKGRPTNPTRAAALLEGGYVPYAWDSPDREHYYIKIK